MAPKEKQFIKPFLNWTVNIPKSGQTKNEWLSDGPLILAVPTLSFIGEYFNLF